MNKSTLKKLIITELINHIFNLNPVKEDMIPAEEPDEDDLDNTEKEPELEPEVPKLPIEPEPEPELPKEPEQPLQQPTQPLPQPTQPEVQRISRLEAIDLVLGTKGRVFTCLFTKRDGSDRLMNCRLGVTRYLKGGSLKFNPEELGLLPVFDMQKRAYRMINFHTMKFIKISHITYDIQ